MEKAEEWCELIAFKARDATHAYGDRQPIAASVKIIDDVKDADLQNSLSTMGKVIVFFNSRDNIDTARRFRRSFPQTSVYVLTDLIPVYEVTILDKEIFLDVPSLAPFLR